MNVSESDCGCCGVVICPSEMIFEKGTTDKKVKKKTNEFTTASLAFGHVQFVSVILHESRHMGRGTHRPSVINHHHIIIVVVDN